MISNIFGKMFTLLLKQKQGGKPHQLPQEKSFTGKSGVLLLWAAPKAKLVHHNLLRKGTKNEPAWAMKGLIIRPELKVSSQVGTSSSNGVRKQGRIDEGARDNNDGK